MTTGQVAAAPGRARQGRAPSALPRRPLPALGAGTSLSLGTRAPNAAIIDWTDLTVGLAVLRIRLDDGIPDALPGQYVSLGLEVDGRLVQRPYSIATPMVASARTGEIELLVRILPDGALTGELARRRVGARVQVGPPRGRFVLHGDEGAQHVFVATGAGMAPIRSMLWALLHVRPLARPMLLHGASQPAELAWRHELQALALTGRLDYRATVSRAWQSAPRWVGLSGRVGEHLGEALASVRSRTLDTVVWICGNPDMVEDVRMQLLDLGLPAERIRSESFGPVRARAD